MRKHKLFKRALAAILTLTMALGILPVTVFAEETSQAAANTAAMQALESRVFTIADEQYTIADLEKFMTVIVTTPENELQAVSGSEIREYLLINPRATTTAGITMALVRTNQTTAYIQMTVVCSMPIAEIKGFAYCCDRNERHYYYQKGKADGTELITKSSLKLTKVIFSLDSFYLVNGSTGYVGYKNATVYFDLGNGELKGVPVIDDKFMF